MKVIILLTNKPCLRTALTQHIAHFTALGDQRLFGQHRVCKEAIDQKLLPRTWELVKQHQPLKVADKFSDRSNIVFERGLLNDMIDQLDPGSNTYMTNPGRYTHCCPADEVLTCELVQPGESRFA
ncbi:hypothetical protein AMC94_07600 [Pseudomonas amygdali pv. aesculi]|nr:hypothetical protein AL041_19340 [Pseudomonas amygdali pv. aesculi]KWT17895.1 hypothetical protein AL044_05890 [Pseudomonas amygdali pv. aesculi]KWT22440.1 hypothetical protein AL043_24315 [Pseudomonas amygdali pv. aesculi]KWT22681.1 hypothetical protein AL042_22325 [Pseudomonas amygdali pv. aesculi]KWT29861.1 hypothetical protein AL045_10985 [Pseudomonas amygdali pv. aesculi]